MILCRTVAIFTIRIRQIIFWVITEAIPAFGARSQSKHFAFSVLRWGMVTIVTTRTGRIFWLQVPCTLTPGTRMGYTCCKLFLVYLSYLVNTSYPLAFITPQSQLSSWIPFKQSRDELRCIVIILKIQLSNRTYTDFNLYLKSSIVITTPSVYPFVKWFSVTYI